MAKGDLLLFVHADTIVPPAFDVTLRKAFRDPKILMSTFLFGINRALLRGKEPFGMAVMERVTNYRTRVIHLPYGDQAFCFTAHKFAEMGGFPDIVMMEDFEVVRRLRKEELAGGGHIHVLDEAALCNPRRWEKQGVFRSSLQNICFALLYVVGNLSADQIFRLYYGRPPPPPPPSSESK
ncbi:glycosyl transferase, group 2 family protein [Ectocarpus siliculosus]|uniref:Glycosyl transferase, group 2 family protein n=1 Tax=Ectocarpus siliculosus TaxID=2880 RepID=D7FSW3_ECTSI|nr:glycosyl transferase, group 2 family protein [Ectocarpus siliculosus]|eukprot:CBJ31254.1 glycosyl transferase, group 2 family protein [Ectocarpus siliculosus]